MLISIQYLSSIMRKNITNQYKTSQVSRITSENIITLFSYWKICLVYYMYVIRKKNEDNLETSINFIQCT